MCHVRSLQYELCKGAFINDVTVFRGGGGSAKVTESDVFLRAKRAEKFRVTAPKKSRNFGILREIVQ